MSAFDYPERNSEVAIMELVRSEEKAPHAKSTEVQKLAAEVVLAARSEISEVAVSKAVEDYIVALVMATRYPDKIDPELAKWIQVGASPRGVIGLDKVSRAHAWLKGRDFADAGRRPGDRPRRIPPQARALLRGPCRRDHRGSGRRPDRGERATA